MGRRIITEQKEASTSSQIDGYFDRLIKYIPSEIVGAWTAIKGIIISSTDIPVNTFLWILFILLTGLTGVYIYKQTDKPNKALATTQILISIGAFIVWAFALGEPFSSLPFYRPIYASIILIIYNLIIPLIIPSEGQNK